MGSRLALVHFMFHLYLLIVMTNILLPLDVQQLDYVVIGALSRLFLITGGL